MKKIIPWLLLMLIPVTMSLPVLTAQNLTAPLAPVQSLNVQPHSITLQWTYTQGTDLATSFNIYRGTSSGGPYNAIGSVFVNTLTFVDSTGVSGSTYYYIVRAADASSLESTNSNEVSGTFLSNPTSLTPPIITSSVVSTSPAMSRFQADWKDTPGSTTAFVIFGGQGQVLKQGSQTSSLGIYEYAIQFPPQTGSISVCDLQECWSQSFTVQ